MANWALICVLSSFSLASVVTLFVAARIRKEGVRLSDTMPIGTWNFNQSWASNLGVGGGVASFVTVLMVLPPAAANLKIVMISYGILVAAISALSVALYTFLKTGPDLQQSRIYVFLCAGVLSLGSAVSQLGLQLIIVGQLQLFIPGWFLRAIQVLLILVVLALFRYGVVTMYVNTKQSKNMKAGAEMAEPRRVYLL